MLLATSNPIGLAIFCIVFGSIAIVYRAFTGPLKAAPGPWHSRFTRLPLSIAIVTGRRPEYVDSLHKKYGPHVRVAPNELAVSDIEIFHHIHRIGTDFMKSDWYHKLTGARPRRSMFTFTNAKDHSLRRRMFSRPMSRKSLLENWHDTVKEMTSLTVNKMYDVAAREGKNMPHTSLTPPDGGTAVQVHFVKKLLVKESKVLAREACCFMSSDHDVADFDRLSFREFQQKWQNEYGKSGKGDGRYPEVRRRNSNKLFLGCTLRCTCGPCSHGKAKELRCDTYDFGDNHTVLIHRFLWGGTTLAMILGIRDHQGGDYSIWGMIDAKTKQLSFHDRVLLREVSRTVLLKRPNRGSVSDGDDDESIPEDKFLEKRVKAPTTLEPHKRPRMLPTAAGNKMSASEETQGNAKTQAYSPVSDDEEDMTLSQLTRPRREAVAGGMPNATPVSTRASSPRRTSPKAQQPQPRDLQKALLDIRAYVNSRAGSDGSPVIFSNAGINRCMRGLGAAASRNDPYLFGNTRATIGEELAMVGLPLLPDI